MRPGTLLPLLGPMETGEQTILPPMVSTFAWRVPWPFWIPSMPNLPSARYAFT